MNKDQKLEKIIPKSEVVVDGDLSIEKVTALINLGREEECLDYKEMFDFSSKSTSKKSKVDLVCDIVSMVNTDGGYILIGVSQNENGTFSVKGVDQICLQRITQENIQTWLSSYIDSTPKILVKPIKYEGRDIITICTFRTKIRIPFRCEGGYKSVNRNYVNKFSSGDLFVRHGAKSEKANYEDYVKMSEKIREDERSKILPATGSQNEIIERLDIIIKLLGGEALRVKAINILKGSEEDIEDRVANLLILKNKILMRRLLKKEFDSIIKFLEDQKEVESYEELLENMNRTFVKFLMQLFAIWVTSIEYKSLDLAECLVKSLHKLYYKTNMFNYRFKSNYIDQLWLQSRIIFIVYCLGAFAILKDKPEYAKLLLNKGNPFNEYWKKRSWFRYVLTMLARTKRLEKNFCALAFDFVKDNSYIINMFEEEDEIINTLCQFDFLQCANNLLKRKDTDDYFPSFAGFNKYRIEPVIEKIIETCDKGLWIDKIDKSYCAEIIRTLDKQASEIPRHFLWDLGEWNSKIIVDFLKNYKNKLNT